MVGWSESTGSNPEVTPGSAGFPASELEVLGAKAEQRAVMWFYCERIAHVSSNLST